VFQKRKPPSFGSNLSGTDEGFSQQCAWIWSKNKIMKTPVNRFTNKIGGTFLCGFIKSNIVEKL